MTSPLRLAALLAAALALPVAAQQMVPGAHFIENWDMDEDGKVSLAEATEKRGEVFYMFDQNEDGLLDSAEYDLFDETREADMRLNAGGHGGYMKRVASALTRDYNDIDHDGQVSETEFLSRVPEWFATMDVNGDAVITVEDFMRLRG